MTSVETDQGTIACDQLVVAAGPWIRDLWAWLDLPETITVARAGRHRRARTGRCGPTGRCRKARSGSSRASSPTTAGAIPPVTHVDSDAPLYDDISGDLITDELWGIYYKPDFNFAGLQGGGRPERRRQARGRDRHRPVRPGEPRVHRAEDFVRMWTSGLAHCHKRFEGKRPLYRHEPTGGIGAFTPDSFPVFDVFRQNAYVIADSNHGFKMIGVGALVARELLGEQQRAARTVQVRPVPHRGAAPGEQLTVPLELTVADNAGTIRMGMIGAGWIAQEHKRVLGSLAEAELVAVCDLDRERAEALASGTGARIYHDWRDLLDNEDLGAVIVCAPPRSHREPAVAALGRGLPVYLEKPIARTAEDAAQIVAAAERQRHRLRGRLPVARARPARRPAPRCWRASRSGSCSGTCIGPTQSRPWFLDMRAGGGNLLERGSHHLDLARTVAGEVAAVQAAAGRVRLARSGGEGRGHRRRPDHDAPARLRRPGDHRGRLDQAGPAGQLRPGHRRVRRHAEARPRPRLHPHRRERRPAGRPPRCLPSVRAVDEPLPARGRERDPAAVVCTPPDAAATLAVAIAAERALETSRAVPVEPF